jgi:hypothetical protein
MAAEIWHLPEKRKVICDAIGHNCVGLIETSGQKSLFFFFSDIFFYLVCEAIGTAATRGLLCQPWVIVKMIVEQMECRLARATEVLLGENLPQHHFCPSQNPSWPDPGLNPGRRGGKPATNRLSYGAALFLGYTSMLVEFRISLLIFCPRYRHIKDELLWSVNICLDSMLRYSYRSGGGWCIGFKQGSKFGCFWRVLLFRTFFNTYNRARFLKR